MSETQTPVIADIPKLAVVGHPNKGKSSIVSTLVESNDIQISNTPGTTLDSQVYPMRVQNKVLYELFDTPGFQRPRKVLDWLEKNSSGAHDRAETVKKFVTQHRDNPEFHDECELLQPLIEGAGILYVVDGSKPFGNEYVAEMQVLRWTGMPRMALINMIGEADYTEEWRNALGQYFSIVRVFNAIRADASKRIELLKSFAELCEEWKPDLNRAVEILQADLLQRKKRSANIIVSLLVDVLTAKVSKNVNEDANIEAVTKKLEEKLKNKLREKELKSRKEIEHIYRHHNIERHEGMMEFLDMDLFSSESAELFGLSRTQIISTGAASGAVAGLGIDVMVGGASLMLGAGLGAVVGGATALFGSKKVGKIKILGKSLADRAVTVGPIKGVNLPWVILSRALLHHQLVSERNHALREALVLETEASRHISENIEDKTRSQLNKIFVKIRQRGHEVDGKALQKIIESLLDKK